MKKTTKFWIPLILILGVMYQASAQSISGKVTDLKGEPIPYANIFVNELQTGTSADGEGYYFINIPARGDYQVIISSLGYETKSAKIVAGDKGYILNVQLTTSFVEMNEMVVKASKRDSAYIYIRKVIENKKKYLASTQSFKSEVYVKATEIIKDEKKDKKEKKQEGVDMIEGDEPLEIDPFAEQQKADQALLSSLNMVEMQLTLNYEYPKKYKEERTAYSRSGSSKGLFIPLFGKTDFNFYRNLVRLDGIAEMPVVSPLSTTSILAYKYKLMETRNENGQIVYKIKVIPRKKSNSTVRGYIYINEGIWNINRLDLEFYKGGLRIFDAFQLKIDYQEINDSIWIPARQEFIYETKQGRFKTFKGNTLMKYSDFQHNYPFPKKFFGNEVVKITQEAYDRDSTYWNGLRPEPLTKDEVRVMKVRDSISAVINSDEYQDSIMHAYNKVTFLELLWDGVGYRNNKKKTTYFVGPIPSMINFSVIGGWRTGPFMFHSKRWEDGRRMSLNARANYGFKNKDVQGSFGGWYRYNPHRLADIRFGFGRSFQSINNYDAFLNQLRTSNYILNDGINASHRFELFNGFFLQTALSYNDRQPLDGYETSTALGKWIEQETEVEDELLVFEGYQAFISDISISYTPGQKYMTRPNDKILLGSDYPTITLLHKKGWKNAFSSDIDFDYLELNLKHDLVLGQFGTAKYTAKVGQFLNTKDLKFIDLKRFRQSDPYWYSNPLYSFQALDTSLATSKLFFEAHYIHHFNGALINNIPLIKKTNIRVVAGGGFLWAQEGNLRHEELFAGIERVFKLGARRRLRVGLYGVVANSNYGGADTAFKISFDVIDTWKRDWEF